MTPECSAPSQMDLVDGLDARLTGSDPSAPLTDPRRQTQLRWVLICHAFQFSRCRSGIVSPVVMSKLYEWAAGDFVWKGSTGEKNALARSRQGMDAGDTKCHRERVSLAASRAFELVRDFGSSDADGARRSRDTILRRMVEHGRYAGYRHAEWVDEWVMDEPNANFPCKYRARYARPCSTRPLTGLPSELPPSNPGVSCHSSLDSQYKFLA